MCMSKGSRIRSHVTRYQALSGILAALLLLSGCAGQKGNDAQTALAVKQTQAYTGVRSFVLNHMIGPDGGVYTNLLPAQTQGDTTRGHDVLAESQGLLMEYAVQTNDAALFSRTWQYVQKNMLLADGLVAWRVVNGQAAGSNATVDDLRVCLALRQAASRFGSTAYRASADRIADALYRTCRQGNDLLSGQKQDTTPPVLLSYLDYDAIRANAQADKRWAAIETQARRLFTQARAGGSLPLYREQYTASSGTFVSQAAADTTASLLTFWYETQAGGGDAARRTALRGACETSGLFASYDTAGDSPASSVQSTAIYALAMLTARTANDAALYQAAAERMKAFQVGEDGGALSGGFGDAKSQTAYSFDNLLALLALTPTAAG